VTVLEARSEVGGRVCDDDSLGVCIAKGAQILNGAVNNPIAIVCEQVCVPYGNPAQNCFNFSFKNSLPQETFTTVLLWSKFKRNLFSSPELKAQVSFSDHLLFVIRLSLNSKKGDNSKVVGEKSKELGMVSIAHRPCPLAKIEVPISSNFFVGIICLIPLVYRNDICFRKNTCVYIINIESKTRAIARIFLKFALFSLFGLSFQFVYIHVRLPNFHEYFFLARRDDCPESYCHDPGVGVTPQGKNFNLGYITWAISFELLGIGC
jgi:hypothetical protein